MLQRIKGADDMLSTENKHPNLGWKGAWDLQGKPCFQEQWIEKQRVRLKMNWIKQNDR